MKRFEKHSDTAFALLRIMAGILFAFHGAEKLFGIFGFHQPAFGSQLFFAGIIEFFGGLTVALGLGPMTRVAALLASGEMAVAYFQVHWRLQMGPKFFPIVNQGELAILYCFIFLFIASRGPVKWGLIRKG